MRLPVVLPRLFFSKILICKKKILNPTIGKKNNFAKTKNCWDIIICKRHFEIRIFTPNIWYPIHSGKSFIENRGNAPKKGQIGENSPQATKIVLIQFFCEEQNRIKRNFAIRFRKSVKFSRIHTDFIQICLKYTFFTSKIR